MHKYAWPIAAFFAVCIFFVGLGVGVFLTTHSKKQPSANKSLSELGNEMRSGQQGLINPLLECDVAAGAISAKQENFDSELSTFVDVINAKPEITDTSVYFRDLNNGSVINVNANEPFYPASLLKVPIMISYYLRSESDPSVLMQKITYQSPATELSIGTQLVPPEQQIQVGKTYTVEQLIEYMIKYSDNQAMALLYDNLPITEQVDVYSQLGVDPSVITDPTGTLTVSQYAIFFRILFNASFLSQADSEKALRLLTQTTFNEGLRSGVPTSVPIAHKFGERNFDQGVQQLHDCGIVYYPGHPYLLCIMTRGTDIEHLEGAIADVSKFVYNKINTEYGGTSAGQK